MTQLGSIIKRITGFFRQSEKPQENLTEVNWVMDDNFVALLDSLKVKIGHRNHCEVLRDAAVVLNIVVEEYEKGKNIFFNLPMREKKQPARVLVFKPKKEEKQ